MVQRALSLDNILSGLGWKMARWTPQLLRNQCRRLIEIVVAKLFGTGKGEVFHAQIRLSQEKLAAELGRSREWSCKLIRRAVTAGWLVFYAPRSPNGHYEVGFFSAGPTLKRFLCGLRAARGQQPHTHVNSPSQSGPLSLAPQETRDRAEDLFSRSGPKPQHKHRTEQPPLPPLDAATLQWRQQKLAEIKAREENFSILDRHPELHPFARLGKEGKAL